MAYKYCPQCGKEINGFYRKKVKCGYDEETGEPKYIEKSLTESKDGHFWQRNLFNPFGRCWCPGSAEWDKNDY